MDHTGSVPGRAAGRRQEHEIPAFAPPLDPLDLEHTLITADAPHTQHAHGAYLRERGAHYLAVVKKNHLKASVEVTFGPHTLSRQCASASRQVGDVPHPQVQHRNGAVEPSHTVPVWARAQSVPIRPDNHGKQRCEASPPEPPGGDITPGQKRYREPSAVASQAESASSILVTRSMMKPQVSGLGLVFCQGLSNSFRRTECTKIGHVAGTGAGRQPRA